VKVIHDQQNGTDQTSSQAIPYFVHLLRCCFSCDWANVYLPREAGSGLLDKITGPLSLAATEEHTVRAGVEEQFAAVAFCQQMEAHPVPHVERIGLCNHYSVGSFAIVDN